MMQGLRTPHADTHIRTIGVGRPCGPKETRGTVRP
jgi:hypothetical protein